MTPHRPIAPVSHAVTPAVFRTWWWLAFIYHTINGAFILILGAMQLFISVPAIYANLWLIQIDRSVILAAGWSMVVIAFAHWAALIMNIVQSLRHLRLTFGHDSSNRPRKKTNDEVTGCASILRRVVSLPATIYRDYLCDTGLFGVYGDYFYVGFFARQAFEIVLQTNQAYQLSRSVQNFWVNGLVVIMILVSCAFVPVVNRVLRYNPAARRMTLLTFDIVLDFLIMVIIPMLVVVPRALEYDWVAMKYQDSLVYDDVWLTNAVAQAQYVMVSSWVDYVATVFPHVSCLVVLDTIKGLVHRRNAAESERILSSNLSMGTDMQVSKKRRKVVSRATTGFYLFALVWAVVVMVCHSKASRHKLVAVNDSCKLHLSAWFTANTTCSVVHINCHQLHLNGTEDEISDALAFVDKRTVKRVILSHCPALSIPHCITELKNMLCLELFNSTLVDWREEAALTKDTTPHMNQLHFIAANFTQFPPALLTSYLPTGLSILIHRGNFSEIPDRFGDVWSSKVWPYFRVERTLLASLPPSFAQIQTEYVSLIGNRLTSLPDDALMGPGLLTILVSHNKLTALPRYHREPVALTQLIAENTSIRALPDWFEAWWQSETATTKAATFKGSPLCSDGKLSELCQDPSIPVEYPYDVVVAQRTW